MTFRLCCLYLCLHITVPVYAQLAGDTTSAEVAGSLELLVDGRPVALSAIHSDYTIDVNGDVVNVRLKQRFDNPFDQPINPRYLFPLRNNAAVHAMTLRVGDEVITAQIQEKQKAQATFKAAKQAGKSAALLEQHRPNMFTQKVANVMPGQSVEVEIAYSHIVPKVDGAYELVVPLIVGPRYQPAGAGVAPEDLPADSSGAAPDTGSWALETLPAENPTAGILLPADFTQARVGLQLNLELPVALRSLVSDTHPITVRHVSSTQADVTFEQGRVLDNKDFVLRYQMAGEQLATGLLSHWQIREGGYFSMLIEPPESVSAEQVLPREMVFLLDCSGSMEGLPMEASKRFMREALSALRPQDSFRIIRFSDVASQFSNHALPATPANISYGLSYVDSLYGSGGTEMASGIRQALGAPVDAGRLRNVVFLTDGYIGNENSVLTLVEQLRGDANLFAFGVGSGVNRYLLDELGRVGRGFTRYFDPTKEAEHMQTVVSALVNRLQTPVLVDLSIDWGDLQVTDVIPTELPDLYLGDTLRVTGRYTQPSAGSVKLSGRSRQHTAQIVTPVALSENADRPAIRRAWARNSVAELMHQFVSPPNRRALSRSNLQLQQAVTQLGLKFDLATRWTSFVAVSKKVYNANPSSGVDANVAVPKVAGVSNLAYTAPAMTGYGAPEPGLLASLAVAMMGFAAMYHRRRRTKLSA